MSVAPLIPVLDEQRRCLGHILLRCPGSVEAFDINSRSLGTFADSNEAAAAVWRAAR